MPTTTKDEGPSKPRQRYSLDCDSKRIDHVTLYRPKKLSSSGNGGKGGKGWSRSIKPYHLLFGIMYVYQAYWCYSTMGVPYQEFLDKAEREGFEVMEGTAKMRAELNHALSDLDNPDRPSTKVGWFDWMNMDIEEHAERKKAEKREREGKTVLDTLPRSMRVPRRYQPSFTSMLVTGLLGVLHLLVVLLQIWSVRFDVWINYVEVDAVEAEVPEEWMELEELTNPLLRPLPAKKGDSASGAGGKGAASDGESGESASTLHSRIEHNYANVHPRPAHLPTHARIVPFKAGQIDVLVPLLYLPSLGLTFEYHRRRYVLDAEEGTWTKVRCNTKMPTSFFGKWRGMTDADQVFASGIRFGENKFDVRQPTFREMYKKQLLSPFTVFQIFCVGLWMLDDYWQYSFFTLFMILTFEATVVFSRIKSLGALRGMGNLSRPVLAYRMGAWRVVQTTELLPGDVMSLTRHKPQRAKAQITDGKDGKPAAAAAPAAPADEEGDVVPADILLLRGSTVVNEASLTGESVPQMKEGISEISEDECMDMKTRHKTHVLYAGTKMLQCKGVEVMDAEEASSDEDEDGENTASVVAHDKLFGDIPRPPDGGCICFVLRTGFSSAQGKLVRMIEGSQEKVKGHEKETALLLLLLFCFAVASSSYVLYQGLKNDNRSQYELLLHCILIITSVIPPELPMQMALAVNNSLMTLMKLQIFCTEPYRVPMAGKLDACLFDKTGTLTTDELVPVGVFEIGSLGSKLVVGGAEKAPPKDAAAAEDPEKKLLTPMTKISAHAALVLSGCHSLVRIEGETMGDPLESAALKAMRWEVSAESGRVVPSAGTEKKPAGRPLAFPGTSEAKEIEILSRHHFSSKLQRMSCVVRDVSNRRFYAVAKGSPEAVGGLLEKKPQGYDEAARWLSRRGFRVISLAYKTLPSAAEADAAKESRSVCEENITFAGFVAFTCRVRRDTKTVLNKLKEGGMSVAMVTGDALLTAIHVAKEVNICDSPQSTDGEVKVCKESNEELKALIETKRAKANETQKKGLFYKEPAPLKSIMILEQAEGGELYWQSYDDDSRFGSYTASEVPELATKYDLAVTGKILALAYEYDDATTTILAHFKVFARMTPDAKETVIECLHSVGLTCLMCGDGANDVGALKQADVGVALLCGFGDVNVDKGEDGNKKKKPTDGKPALVATMTKEQLQALQMSPAWAVKQKLKSIGIEPEKMYPEITEKADLIKLYQIKAGEYAIKKHEQKKRVEKMQLTKQEGKAKQMENMADKQKKMQLRVLELEAQGVQWAQFKAVKEMMAAEAAEGKKRKAAFAQKNSIAGSAANFAGQLEDLEIDELPMVKIGDASVAAPFTSKMPSIKSCVDIVRQGRCTLVTTIQMYQILALNCLISAYSLSVLYLDGVKYGDVQMTAMGILGSVSFMSVSRAKPLEKLSSVKPLTSIFHPSLFISLLGQFSVHLATMMWAVHAAKQDPSHDSKVDLDGEFKPGILNSVVFLVSNVQQVCVFVVNLQGRPFMTGLTENRPLLWSLLATFILTFMFASESVPGLNKYFQLVPFPSDSFRDFILKILIGDVITSFLFDRLMKLLFCPEILKASVEGTTAKDVMYLARTVAVIGFLMKMFLGDSDQWEEMLEEEARLLSEMNATDGSEGGLVDAVKGVVKACIGADCDATMNDEF